MIHSCWIIMFTGYTFLSILIKLQTLKTRFKEIISWEIGKINAEIRVLELFQHLIVVNQGQNQHQHQCGSVSYTCCLNVILYIMSIQQKIYPAVTMHPASGYPKFTQQTHISDDQHPVYIIKLLRQGKGHILLLADTFSWKRRRMKDRTIYEQVENRV